ncbi:hypothetical protein AWC04_01220 [Mycolicibacterium fallax]|uniref:Uncharacterized protein n=1 Tax=Mycolicibacterium fallax TaxID=1793 RepID=A0A1X1RMG6_MYCFA|nr:hypothetical protein [Mycolicibacterium fallax]ORV09704.1 hypothetical protein AWC04_01220 [Mycolicibacterium fallax]BBZ00392.1 hypothetical protein MFAL_38580 [Mycolicibacterium fallax]
MPTPTAKLEAVLSQPLPTLTPLIDAQLALAVPDAAIAPAANAPDTAASMTVPVIPVRACR